MQSLSALVTVFTFRSSFIAIASGTQLLLVASHVLSILSVIPLCLLSWLEYRRSIYPSDLTVLYLAYCLLRNAIQVFYLNEIAYSQDARFPLVTQMVLQAVLLMAESFRKDSARVPRYQKLSVEETSGVINRTFFWWINSILIDGYYSVLGNVDLPAIDSTLSSGTVRDAIIQNWDRRSKSTPCLPLRLAPNAS